MTKETNYFKILTSVDVTKHVKKKGAFNYLSWAIAWNYIKTSYPDAQRIVYEAPDTGLNWFSDGITAYVKVGISVSGIEHIDYLPIKDFRHNSITVDKLTTMDVNTAIQRSTAKAIAMHGLGLNLYANEDTLVIPEDNEVAVVKKDIMKPPAKIVLEMSDKNYDNVMVYMLNNKDQGFDALMAQVMKKYKVSAKVSRVLRELVAKKMNAGS
tara:strand:+ start:1046 stop:1678 length:633 start_codon:yes stop_codon:yes gene_type:complete